MMLLSSAVALMIGFIIPLQTILFFRLNAAGYAVSQDDLWVILLLLPLGVLLLMLSANPIQRGDVDFLLRWLSKTLNVVPVQLCYEQIVKESASLNLHLTRRIVVIFALIGLSTGTLIGTFTRDIEAYLPSLIVRVSDFAVCSGPLMNGQIHEQAAFAIGETVFVCGYIDFVEEPNRENVEEIYFIWRSVTTDDVYRRISHVIRNDGFFSIQLGQAGNEWLMPGDYQVTVARDYGKAVQAQRYFSIYE